MLLLNLCTRSAGKDGLIDAAALLQMQASNIVPDPLDQSRRQRKAHSGNDALADLAIQTLVEDVYVGQRVKALVSKIASREAVAKEEIERIEALPIDHREVVSTGFDHAAAVFQAYDKMSASSVMRGTGPYMEDRLSQHVFTVDGRQVSSFAVFDGHGGRDVAMFLVRDFHHILEDSLTQLAEYFEGSLVDPSVLFFEKRKPAF